jgi:lysophospholipase L1-like esterase
MMSLKQSDQMQFGNFRATAVLVTFLSLISVLIFSLNSGIQAEDQSPFALQENDRIVFVGNTLTERMLDYGYLESILTTQYPKKNLTFRSLAWSADTVSLRPRPLNFGTLDVHLKNQKPDVVFVCFGMNESFQGSGGLKNFQEGLTKFVKNLKEKKYNGKSAPRIILLSPIPHETKGSGLPDPTEHNSHLSAYTNVIQTVAKEENTAFVNLFEKVQPFMQSKNGPDLTVNGIHQNAYGDWVVSHVIADSLGLLKSPEKIALRQSDFSTSVTLHLPISVPNGIHDPAALKSAQPVIQVTGLNPGTYILKHKGTVLAKATNNQWGKGVSLSKGPWIKDSQKLRATIIEKNRQFFYRWRAVNGEYIYGRRKEPFGVVNFPPEMKKLDQIVKGMEDGIAKLSGPKAYFDFEFSKE